MSSDGENPRRRFSDRKPDSPTPDFSVVIPVYNEEGLVFASVCELVERVKDFHGGPYEIIITENGSRDDTVEMALQLERKFHQVRVLSSPEPNYGAALKRGIEASRGKYVICDEIDICDSDFHRRALELLRSDQCDMVVGSKLHPDSKDRRGAYRHAATITLNALLRLLLGFKGTDTHGLKAFRRETLLEVLSHCITDKDIFTSEFVIRAGLEKLRILEVPVHIVEKRAPSINLIKRVPNVLKNIGKLFVAIRLKG